MEGQDIPMTTMSGSLKVEQTDEPGSIQRLDSEIEWLEESLKRLEVRIGPVLSQYATAEVATPKPEPPSQLRGRIERIANLRSALNEIIDRVDL